MFDINKRSASRETQQTADAESRGLEEDMVPSMQPSARVREAAIIGPSIHIDGDLRGEEDLVIEGEVKGAIHLSDHGLTVGAKGKVHANVYAHTIVVDGRVEGDLYGAERVSIRKNGQVTGNVISPRVSLEDGGRFKGSIEMDEEAVARVFGQPPKSAAKSQAGGSASERPGTGEPGGGSTESKTATSSAQAGTSGASGKPGGSGESSGGSASAKTAESSKASGPNKGSAAS